MNLKAIVIDDSRSVRMILKGMLEKKGFEVIEAENGLNALDKLKQTGPVELALVDWNMPEMNGYEFLCQIRSDSIFNEMKIIMVTTESEIERMVSALDSGANEYLMKPFTEDGLFEKIQMVEL